MAGQASSMDVPLHTDLGILAQRRRRLLRQARAASIKARHLPVRCRLASSNQSLRRRTQRRTKALHMDCRSRQNHPGRQTRVPSVRFDPLEHREAFFHAVASGDGHLAFKMVGRLRDEEHDPGELAFLEATASFHSNRFDEAIKHAREVPQDAIDCNRLAPRFYAAVRVSCLQG